MGLRLEACFLRMEWCFNTRVSSAFWCVFDSRTCPTPAETVDEDAFSFRFERVIARLSFQQS